MSMVDVDYNVLLRSGSADVTINPSAPWGVTVHQMDDLDTGPAHALGLMHFAQSQQSNSSESVAVPNPQQLSPLQWLLLVGAGIVETQLDNDKVCAVAASAQIIAIE